jgi:hypothetical protein
MRRESRVGSVSWVPSDVVTGSGGIPFLLGLARSDEPPPDVVDDARALLDAGRVRQANELRAWVEFDEAGHPTAWGYAEGSDDVDEEFPVLRAEPEADETSVRFVQTVGGRLGSAVARKVLGRPFLRVEAPVAWTTLGLTVSSAGDDRGELLGASPFPRHWVYDAAGQLHSKSAEIDFRRWREGSHTGRTPWGDEGSREFVALAESALERRLSRRIMGSQPAVRTVEAGTMVTQQGDADDTVYLVLDGILDVDVGGQTVAEVGPGAVVGERSAADGRRSATLRARTHCRIVPLAPTALTSEEREQLAAQHRREDD